MAMAMASATLLQRPLLQDASTRLAAAAGPSRQRSPSSVTWRRRGCGSGGEKCRLQISNIFGAAQATRSRGQTRLAARADGAAPGDLLTEDAAAEDEAVEDETCEIVQGSNVLLGEGQEAVQAYLIQAIKNNNGVGVLCLTDDYGFENEDSRGFAYRLACFGYNVLVPDLFQGEPWSEDWAESEYEEWKELHSPDKVAGRINEATKYLLEELDTVGKLVVIGFGSGGGRLIETLASDSDQHFASGAFLYGTGFESSLTAQIKVPLLLIAGDSDSLCAPEIIRRIEQEVQGSKAKIYSGVGHAFAHRPSNSEEDEVSEEAFTEIRHWFHNLLLPGTALVP